MPARLPARRGATQSGKLRLAATRRTTTALPEFPGSSPSPTEQADGKEIVNLIEAEIERLPEKYRSALLICWFEDDSLDEAASRLGISHERGLMSAITTAKLCNRLGLAVESIHLSSSTRTVVMDWASLWSANVQTIFLSRVTSNA